MNNHMETLLHDPLARVAKLEAQANHSGDINKMVPPPVATDEELRRRYHDVFVLFGHTNTLRAIYNLGVTYGQARSREVAEPAPVAGVLVKRVKLAIDSVSLDEEARAAILEVATWLREQGTPASGWAMRLEQEAGR